MSSAKLEDARPRKDLEILEARVETTFNMVNELDMRVTDILSQLVGNQPSDARAAEKPTRSGRFFQMSEKLEDTIETVRSILERLDQI